MTENAASRSAGAPSTRNELEASASRTIACGLRPNACVARDVGDHLRAVGLRPTRQRIALGRLLYAQGDRHVTAEILHEEALRARVPVSLATIYNTLHQFTEAGLLREVAVDGSKTYFDTNVSDHHHFLVEGENTLFDIPEAHIELGGLPTAPEGMEIARVDVVVRLRRKER